MSNDALHGLITRAAAYEAVYSEKDSDNKPVVETVPIINVGVHKGNRGGVYTQGSACRTVLQSIMEAGFNKDEADYQGGCGRGRETLLARRRQSYNTILRAARTTRI